MFNIGGGELLVIAILALLVLGPDKLPQAAKQAGKFMSEARKMSAGFRQEIKSAIDEADATTATAAPSAGAAASDDAIEAQARERGRQLASAPDGAEPIGDQPVSTEPVERPAGNGTNGNGRGRGLGALPTRADDLTEPAEAPDTPDASDPS